MLISLWLWTLLPVAFEFIWSRANSPMIQAPPVSGPTSVLLIAAILVTLHRWYTQWLRAAAKVRTRESPDLPLWKPAPNDRVDPIDRKMPARIR